MRSLCVYGLGFFGLSCGFDSCLCVVGGGDQGTGVSVCRAVARLQLFLSVMFTLVAFTAPIISRKGEYFEGSIAVCLIGQHLAVFFFAFFPICLYVY